MLEIIGAITVLAIILGVFLFGLVWSTKGQRVPSTPVLLQGSPDMGQIYNDCGLGIPDYGDNQYLWDILNEPEKTEVTPVFFKEGEPRSFKAYQGQLPVLSMLQDAIGAMTLGQRSIRPQLFAGWAGNGKTLLAKVVANELNARNLLNGFSPAPFFEYMPVALETVQALDSLMRKVQQNPGCVVFLDEVHSVAGRAHFLKFYQVLEENRYHFEGEPFPVELPEATYLAATTDYGALVEAFKRRWTVHFFQPATQEQLANFIRNRPFPIEEDAIDAIVERMHYSGAPWECLQIYDLATNSAKASGRNYTTVEDVFRVYDLHGVDELGLRTVDRQVIQGLFKLRKTKVNGETRFCGSEDNVVNMGRVDKSEFKATIRPKLLTRGLLEIQPYWGHTLTEKAVERYAHLQENE